MPTTKNKKNQIVRAAEADPMETSFSIDITKCSMVIKDNVPYELWKKKFSELRELNGVLLWFLGDMILYAEKNYGDRCYQAFDEFDYDVDMLKKTAWVAGKFEPGNRFPQLTWTHHHLLAGMDEKDRNKWLNISAREKWTTGDLKKALKSEDGSKVLEAPSVKLLTLFTSLKDKAEEIFKSMPIDKWDPELLEKMKETFYGTVYDIESLTGWKRSDSQRTFVLKGKAREI